MRIRHLQALLLQRARAVRRLQIVRHGRRLRKVRAGLQARELSVQTRGWIRRLAATAAAAGGSPSACWVTGRTCGKAVGRRRSPQCPAGRSGSRALAPAARGRLKGGRKLGYGGCL